MVPSDLHFIIRHGLTGLMFLFFVVFGVWNVEVWTRLGCDVAHSLAFDLQPHCTVVKLYAGLAASDWLVLAISVIIGITLQGVQMMLKFRQQTFFTDPARIALAQRVVDVISKDDLDDLQGKGLEFYRQRLGAVARDHPDALYVWVYHSDADDKLVEWAHRRRSYHYLGVHFASAFVVGTMVGILIGIADNYPITLWYPQNLDEIRFQIVVQAFIIVCFVVWALGAWRLSVPMLREADAMELAWSCGRLHPSFKKAVFGADPPTGANADTAHLTGSG